MTFRIAPNGFQSTEIGLIPDDWKIKQAKDISGCIVPGRNKPKKFDGTIPWVTTSDIDELGRINNSKISLFISKEEANAIGSRVVPANSVIMSCVGELGVVAVVEDEIVINQQLHAFLPHSKVNSKYLSYVLSSLREYFYGKATKTTLPYLNKDNCNSTPIPLPCFEEQTAIANALSDVDALLTELEKLIAKKQAIKTATMQQLLTGKTRLPQFATYTEGEKQGVPEGKSKGTKPSELGEIPEDWDVTKLGELGKFKNGINKDADSFGHGSPFINLMDVFGKPQIKGDENFGLIHSTPLEQKEYGVLEGDVLFIRSSVKPSGVGLTSVAKSTLKQVVYSGFLIRFRSNKILDNKFKVHCFYEESFRKRIVAASTVSANTNINQDALKDIQIAYPVEIEEQSAIATILSDMDNEIQTLEQRLTKTRQIKQGMMQQLLTGRTRLPFDSAPKGDFENAFEGKQEVENAN